jgi:phosphatidate cytidylyltransferase
MLRERILTALVLLALLIPAVMAGNPLWFELLTALLIGAAGWEWGRLCGLGGAVSLVSGVVLFFACTFVGPGYGLEIPSAVWLVVTALWIGGGAIALRAGPDGFKALNGFLRFIVGWVLIGAAWAALIASKDRGLAYLATVCGLVWMADIAAYFVGRAIGRRKLAPTISPGKSWEGAIGGLVGVLLLALLVVVTAARPHGNLFWLLRTDFGWFGLLLACAGLVALAITGDLVESLVKRAAGAKDSSGLLPGHGGVLDRIDALLPVFPAALALVTAF